MNFFFNTLLDFAGYGVARLALPLLSLGKVYAQSLGSQETNFNMLGYRHDGQGRIEISSFVATSVGLVISLAGLCLFAVLISTRS